MRYPDQRPNETDDAYLTRLARLASYGATEAERRAARLTFNIEVDFIVMSRDTVRL